MIAERAQEILDAINKSKYGWHQDTSKFFKEGEIKEVIKKWDTMSDGTCFADALFRIAKGD